MRYGRALKIIRGARGWSQNDLALEADLDNSFISLIESGHRQPTVDALEKIAQAFDVPLCVINFLAGENHPQDELYSMMSKELATNLLKF